MIDTDHRLPVVRQAQLLEFSRSSVYYLPRPASSEDLALMRRIDELEHPFAGSRMMRDFLKGEGHFMSQLAPLNASVEESKSPRIEVRVLAKR